MSQSTDRNRRIRRQHSEGDNHMTQNDFQKTDEYQPSSGFDGRRRSMARHGSPRRTFVLLQADSGVSSTGGGRGDADQTTHSVHHDRDLRSVGIAVRYPLRLSCCGLGWPYPILLRAAVHELRNGAREFQSTHDGVGGLTSVSGMVARASDYPDPNVSSSASGGNESWQEQ